MEYSKEDLVYQQTRRKQILYSLTVLSMTALVSLIFGIGSVVALHFITKQLGNKTVQNDEKNNLYKGLTK